MKVSLFQCSMLLKFGFCFELLDLEMMLMIECYFVNLILCIYLFYNRHLLSCTFQETGIQNVEDTQKF